ncbi:hypothetical protein BLNAU_23379 [Blattamonas nauphoetae]|uniref:SPRY domain-containing protein n=1 Tax=Blattamonas nauphoetae TaxID=2049346 RepID=A0ABQ9WQF5_9EUKA|nr:hypothetical protein BLNAU_23379 [Blattamonas nauphoetae]
MDSTSRFRDSDEILGVNINNSVSCHSELKESDCVRMEVDLDSTLRTVQFFVNGEAGRSYVSGLPPSVRIGDRRWLREARNIVNSE